METKAELYRAAMQIAMNYRQRAYAKADARRVELLKKVPEYEPLRRLILHTSIERARVSAEGASQQTKDDLDAKLATLQAQQDEQLHIAGVKPQDLLPHYHCMLCNDTGVTNGVRCSCIEQEMRRLRREQINREFPLDLSDFAHFTLEKYSAEVQPQLGTSPRAVMTQVLEYCTAYAQHFRLGCGNVLMMGDVGLGKTHLALAIAGVVLEKGYDVVYVSSQQAFAAIDNLRSSEGTAWLEAMLEADLLVLDDLGTEYVIPHTLSVLYQLVNTRMSSHRPTVYTTNILSQQLMNSRYTEKVSSRLLGGCEILQLCGDDVRLQGK